MGFVVPKYNRSAVERNRLKRQLREIVRIEMLPSLLNADIVIKARPNAYDAQFSILAGELQDVSQDIGQALI